MKRGKPRKYSKTTVKAFGARLRDAIIKETRVVPRKERRHHRQME